MPYKDKNRYQSEEYKEYQRNYQRAWHQRNKAKRLPRMYERRAARRAAIQGYIQDMKNQLCCMDCGQRHPAILHFHHLNPADKLFNIGEAVDRGFSVNKIKKEIEKCVVLCANCHIIRHYNMRKTMHTESEIAENVEELSFPFIVDFSEERDTNAS